MSTEQHNESTALERSEDDAQMAQPALRLQRVAAALDGFPEGRDAAVLAAAIAGLAGAEARLVAVHPDPMIVMPPGSRWHDLRAGAEKLLRATRDDLGLPLGTPMRVETDWSVARALDRVVRRDLIDLLVLGSSRGAQPGGVEIGRVTRQLLGESPSALAVAPQGLSEGVTSIAIRRIGVGYDGGAESALALGLAAALATTPGTELLVSAVIDDRLPSISWAGGNATRTAALWDAVLTPDRDALEAQARAAVNRLSLTAEVRAELGNPVTIIHELSSEVDLLVIGSRRWGTFARVVLGSIGETLMRGARCPVLVAPRPAIG